MCIQGPGYGGEAVHTRVCAQSRFGHEPVLTLSDRYVRQLEEQVKNLSALVERTRVEEPVNSSFPGRSPGLAVDDGPVADGDPRRNQRGDIDAILTPNSASTRLAGEQEVSGINCHTRNVEFYGSSSSVALLSHVQRADEDLDGDAAALLSSLHNPAFRSATSQAAYGQRGQASQPGYSNHYPQCRGFLESFFSTIHYVHPILDKRPFLERCEMLWSETETASCITSFTALYYSVLSLGALVGVRDDDPIGGMGNVQWSRRFFDEAKRCCNQLDMVTDLEMVQCYFILVFTPTYTPMGLC